MPECSPSEEPSQRAVPVTDDGRGDLFRDVVDALPVATVVLDRAGIVTAANKAFGELLQVPIAQITGEPFLTWLSRASEREGFGRAFVGLRDREPGSGFVLDLGFLPKLGPRVDCVVRSSKLPGGEVAVTCHPTSASRLAPEAELGLAVTRSLDALDQGVLLVDNEGKVVHANPAGVKLLGEGVVGRSVLEIAERSSAPILARALTVARAGSWQGELTFRRVDGETVPVEVSLAAGTGPAVVLVRDLRERRRREFEERLVAQVDRCLIQSDDPQKSVLDGSAALASALGAGRVCLLVRGSDGWQRWGLTGDEPEDAVALGPGFEPPAAWALGRDVDVTDCQVAALREAFGQLHDFASAARIALRGPSGIIGHLLLAHRDPDPWDPRDVSLITTVASALALGLSSGLLTLETRELAAYQAMLLNQTTVLLGSVDADGRVVTWNRASDQLIGVSAADAVGQRFGHDVAVASEPEQFDDLWTTLLREGEVAREITLRHRSGDEIPLHLEGRRLTQGDEVRGAVFVGLDLRERRALETQILRSQKLAAVGLLAAGIAHEINNPLSGVVGYSKLLLEKPLPDPIRQKVEKIAASGERCRKIVEGVLLFSRQRDTGERRQVDLRDLMDRVVAIGEYQWKMHNVRIIRDVQQEAAVFGDPDQLEQVLLNLLSNAVDAMPHGGTIHATLGTTGDGRARLSVADQGHGIPDEVLARIFDPFFSTKEIGKGTGLGLAISYGIVHDHGGDIEVESVAGRGATFNVLLPLHATPTDSPNTGAVSAP